MSQQQYPLIAMPYVFETMTKRYEHEQQYLRTLDAVLGLLSSSQRLPCLTTIVSPMYTLASKYRQMGEDTLAGDWTSLAKLVIDSHPCQDCAQARVKKLQKKEGLR
ncbi:MAG: hypothetical protein ACMXYF_01685 [Candidatus Woesearchaeota archaeon]